MRSKRLRLVSEQRKTAWGTGFSVLVAREMKQEPKNESGGALLLTPFFAQSLTLVPRSLLLNRTETFATQASTSSTYNNVACIRVRHRFYIWVRCLLCWVQSSLLWEIPFRMLQFFLLLINYNIRSWTQEHFQTPFLNSQVMLSPLYQYSRMACTRICRS